jgi:hypothetical protein
MPMKHKYLTPSLRKFLEDNPDLFMRCDASGKENPNGEFWNARELVARCKIIKPKETAAGI